MRSTKNDQFCDPTHPQKLTIDLLFKNDRIRKYVANFKTPPFQLPCGRHKCMVPCTSDIQN